MKKNVASQYWYVYAFDETTNIEKTADAANITAKISKDGAAGSGTNDVNPTELESGWYKFDLTQAETNADQLLIIPVSSTANIQVVGAPASVFTTEQANYSLRGIADSGTTTTMVDAALTEADTDYWAGSLIRFISGNIAGQTRLITAFTPGTDTITFTPATTQAVGTNEYEILPWGDVDTVATLTGHTAQTGDSYARLGAPAGASVSADIATVDTVVDGIQTDLDNGTDGLGAIKADTAAILVDTADIQPKLGTVTDLGGGATLANNLSDMAGATFSTTTDSQEAIRDRGDAAWTTGSGTGLTALASGTAQAGTSSTIQLAAGETFADDELNGNVVKITSGTGNGQSRVITDYTGSTDTATVSPNWTTTPDATSVYEVVAGSVNITVVSNVAEDLPTATALATVDSNVDAILVDTADIQPKLGTLSDLGSGATVADNLSDMAGATFLSSTDSLQAIRDHGDTDWKGLSCIATNIAQGGTSSTIQLASSETYGDDILNGTVVNIISGTGRGQSRVIIDYTGATDTATVTPDWITTPSTNSEYEIWAGSANIVSVSNVAEDLPTATALATVQADTDDIQTRLPAALVGGRMDASVGAMATDVITSTAIAADAIGSSELATTAVNEIRDSILADATTFNGADIAAILTDTGTTLDTKLNDIQGATFSSATDSLEALRDRGDAAWTTGSGTGLTALASGTAQAGTASTIQLAAGETFADDELNGNIVAITSGTGTGQSRRITDYTGSTDTATVSPNWTTNPDATSVYEVVVGMHRQGDWDDIKGATFSTSTDSLEAIRDRGDAAWTTGAGGTGLTALASGVAQAGTASTIQLASAETFADDELNGTVVNIVSGTGVGQSRVIIDYTGATDTATVSPNWTTNPDATSNYEVVNGSVNITVVSNVAEDLPTATAMAVIQSDTDDIQTRLPAALVGGKMDSDVSAIQAGVITAAAIATDAIDADALATDAVNEIVDAVWDEPLEDHDTQGNAGWVQAYSVYIGGHGPGICIDSAAANTNTVVGTDGTSINPVSTLAAAKTIADSLGIMTYYFMNASDLTLDATYTDWTFIGMGEPTSNIINLGSQDVSRSKFMNIAIEGTQGGAGRMFAVNCALQDPGAGDTTLHIFACLCGIVDRIQVDTSNDNVFDQCYSLVAGSGAPVIQATGAAGTIAVRHYSGGIEFESLSASHNVSLETDGQVIFNADCNVNANVSLRGNMTIVDNTGGMANLTTDAVYDKRADIAAILVDTGTTIPATLGTPAGADLATDIATIDTVVDGIQADLDNGTDGLGAIKADTAAILVDTADMQPKLGTPAGADMSADIAAVKSDTAATLVDTNELQGDLTDGGRLDLLIDAIKVVTDALGSTAATNLALSAGQILPFTVDTVTNGHTPTTTVFQADDITEATADHYNGRIVIFTSGVLSGQATDITDYATVGGIGQFTVTAMTEAPANNDTGIIV